MADRRYPPLPTRPAARMYDRAYRQAPNWDLGRPQAAFVLLEERGLIGRRVVDVGCGTGELSIFLAGRGHEVLGVDFSREAVARAREKARWRRSAARFLAMDALDLALLRVSADAVVDSGLFHVLGNAERGRFVHAMESVLPPGGRYFVLGDARPDGTPHGEYGVSRRELADRFAEPRGWRLDFVYPTAFERRRGASPALLGGATRL